MHNYTYLTGVAHRPTSLFLALTSGKLIKVSQAADLIVFEQCALSPCGSYLLPSSVGPTMVLTHCCVTSHFIGFLQN